MILIYSSLGALAVHSHALGCIWALGSSVGKPGNPKGQRPSERVWQYTLLNRPYVPSDVVSVLFRKDPFLVCLVCCGISFKSVVMCVPI